MYTALTEDPCNIQDEALCVIVKNYYPKERHLRHYANKGSM